MPEGPSGSPRSPLSGAGCRVIATLVVIAVAWTVGTSWWDAQAAPVATPAGSAIATPNGSPVATPAGESPYGIGRVRVPPGLDPDAMADRLSRLPDDVAGLPQQRTLSDADSATVIYLIDTDPNAPRFGIVVAVKVPAAADADGVVARLERERWGDPKDHDVTGAGAGGVGQPAYREFSRSFSPAQFALADRPVYFLLWYRAGEEYAFMVIGDTPAVREALARAVVGDLGRT